MGNVDYQPGNRVLALAQTREYGPAWFPGTILSSAFFSSSSSHIVNGVEVSRSEDSGQDYSIQLDNGQNIVRKSSDIIPEPRRDSLERERSFQGNIVEGRVVNKRLSS